MVLGMSNARAVTRIPEHRGVSSHPVKNPDIPNGSWFLDQCQPALPDGGRRTEVPATEVSAW